MRTPKLVIALVAVSSLGVANASAEIVLELLGPTELTVEPAIPYGPNTPLPADGESLVVWAQMTNTGTEVFEALGPAGIGAWGEGTTSLFLQSPVELWDPMADPDDPLIATSDGLRGILLEPGESFAIAVAEVWGLQFGGATAFSAAEVGSFMTVHDLTLSMWGGFDSDPNTDPLDVFLTLDSSFTVTVVPEPQVLVMLALLAVPLTVRKRER